MAPTTPYAYNALAAVDESDHIIVAAELVNSAADNCRLATMPAAVKRDAGDDAKQVAPMPAIAPRPCSNNAVIIHPN